MAEETKTPYDTLLEELDALRKENEALRTEFNDLRDFNRALLARNGTFNNENKDNTKDKFDAYLKGE